MMTKDITTNTFDSESLKDLMLAFVGKSLALTPSQQQSLIENSRELAQSTTLPDLIAHLQSKDLEIELIEKIKTFGREDAVL